MGSAAFFCSLRSRGCRVVFSILVIYNFSCSICSRLLLCVLTLLSSVHIRIFLSFMSLLAFLLICLPCICVICLVLLPV